jgi:DNA-binding NarL/FixJ family response regulator
MIDPSIRILIADDQAVVRSGLRAILEDEADLEIVGEAQDGAEAIALVARRRPDVVLMDIRMPGMDGLQATRLLAGPGVEHPANVIVITTFSQDEYVFGALRAGAVGFLLKDAQPQVLIDAIRSVHRGFGLVAQEVTRRLISEFAAVSPDATGRATLATLTQRERDVLLQLAQGSSNAQIARELFLEETTVKSHVSNLLSKLNVNNRVQAVIFAYENGLVNPGARLAARADASSERTKPVGPNDR